MVTYSFTFLIALLQIFEALIVLAVKDPKACFDVLDKAPRDDVRNIYFMNFNKVAHTHPATDILACFLHASHPQDKSVTEQYFDVYKKCDYFVEKNFKPFGNQQLEELVALGLPYSLEMDLRKNMKTGSKQELEKGIAHVQAVTSNKIELSSEFKHYKEFISKKLNQRSNQTADH